MRCYSMSSTNWTAYRTVLFIHQALLAVLLQVAATFETHRRKHDITLVYTAVVLALCTPGLLTGSD